MTVLVLNAATFGVSEWDLSWVGIVDREGVVYGVAETEVQKLDKGGENLPIGRVRTGELTFGTDRDKCIPKAYLELKHGDTVTFTAGYSSYGDLTDHDYPLAVRATDATENATYRRESLSRGERGQWWAFGLFGSDWSLGALRVLTDIVSRKF